MVLMYYESGNMYTGCVIAVHGRLAVWHARNVNAPGTTIVCDPDYWTQLPEPPEND